MGLGIAFGLVVLVSGLMIMFGMMWELPILLAVGFVIFALCAIFGVQPDWPSPRRQE